MKIEFVKPTVGNYDDEIASYITEGKVYQVVRIVSEVIGHIIVVIKDDIGNEVTALVNSVSAHLKYRGMFVPCDENGKEIK